MKHDHSKTDGWLDMRIDRYITKQRAGRRTSNKISRRTNRGQTEGQIEGQIDEQIEKDIEGERRRERRINIRPNRRINRRTNRRTQKHNHQDKWLREEYEEVIIRSSKDIILSDQVLFWEADRFSVFDYMLKIYFCSLLWSFRSPCRSPSQ